MMTRIIIFVLLIGTLFACEKKGVESAVDNGPVPEDRITLSDQQLEAAQIRTGKISRSTVNRELALNGVIDVPPQNHITVSPPADGFVRNIRVKEGMKVRKGDLLLTLENMAFIQMQQDYLENSSKLEFLTAEYERQKALARESINSGKSVQQAKSNYEGTLSIVRGLEARLKMLGIPVDKISNGEITSRINVYSPTNGYVAGVVEGTGHFVQTTETLLRIINVDHLHLLLHVFEKDITTITPGQSVEFRLANDTTRYQASVYLVGREITPERTIRVHCHLKAENDRFIPGMYVTATLVSDAHEADVLPVESVVSWGAQHGIFLADGDHGFRLLEINTGQINGRFIEVLIPGSVDRNSDVVTSGAQHLLGMLKNNPED